MYYFIIIKASFQDFLEAPLDAAKYCCKALHLAGLARIPGFEPNICLLGKLVM